MCVPTLFNAACQMELLKTDKNGVFSLELLYSFVGAKRCDTQAELHGNLEERLALSVSLSVSE